MLIRTSEVNYVRRRGHVGWLVVGEQGSTYVLHAHR
jgi:hypothetical protein